MSVASAPMLVILEGATCPPAIEAASGCTLHNAASPLEAAALLRRRPATYLVIDPSVAWHLSFVRLLPKEARPAVVAIGETAPHADVVDEWFCSAPGSAEAAARLGLARERARERMKKSRRAFSDSLTGLPNRRAAIRALVREAARSRRHGTPVALVLLDFDGFKRINDTSGHAAGDRLLRSGGRALAQVVRETELCGRIGGDEFALVLQGDLDDAHEAARRMTDALHSVGIAASSAAAVLGPKEQLRDFYRRTDELLGYVKEARRTLLQLPKRGAPTRKPPRPDSLLPASASAASDWSS